MIRIDFILPTALAVLIAAGPLCSAPVLAQGVDMAAERARIANERIRRDMQRRQGDEEDAPSGEEAVGDSTSATALPYAASRPPAPAAAYAPVAGGASATTSAGAGADPASAAADSYSRTLSQLRVLGELRDAGYLTDDEFARIKTRIISSVF